jgi:PadR family transcriptional regulator, regulatory protein PadR
MRMTNASVAVAAALLEQPRGKHWGYDLSRRANVRSGVLYPMLKRMLDDGWLEDGWEDPSQLTDRRSPRRYYTITDIGLAQLGALMHKARDDVRFRALARRYA